MKFDSNFSGDREFWFKSKAFRVGALILAIAAVVLVVLFSRQIGDLLELFGLKAARETQTITIDGTGLPDRFHFMVDMDIDKTDTNAFALDPDKNNSLILNPVDSSQ